MNQETIEEISKLTDKIVGYTISKEKDPHSEVNRALDNEVRRLRGEALLLRGAAGEIANRSFLMWEGSELTAEEKKFRGHNRD